MRITLSEPKIVAMGPCSETAGWGVYQFPDLWKLPDGRLLYSFHDAADSVTAYGSEKRFCLSCDNGNTWAEVPKGEIAHLMGLQLSNGDLLRFQELPSIPTESLNLPEPVGTSVKGFTVYKMADLPDGICQKSWQFIRITEAHPDGITESATIHWPHMFTAAAKGVLIQPTPRGRLRLAPDGSLWMPHYTAAGIDPESGELVSRQMSNYLFRSTDNGHTWDLMTFLPYHPASDREAHHEGYNENDIAFAPDGSMIRLIRTQVIYPTREFEPMLITRSTDGGHTWTEPEYFDFTGVWPCLLTLGCGVTLATYGRPGLFLRATNDPACLQWEDRMELIHSSGERDTPGSVLNRATCSYTDMIPLDDHTAGLAYSDFTIKDENGVPRKTMMFRTITVEP